jgi:adenylate cyclase, class 2
VEAPRTNVELKARDPDPAKSLARCLEIGAEDNGVLLQRDTYFAVPQGRLKLREQDGLRPHLIAYERPDRPELRQSRYFIAEVGDPIDLRALLESVLGIRAEVTKRRRLFLDGSVRIHLDEVDALGHFIELEGVAAPGSDLAAENAEVEGLRAALAIEDRDLVGAGYLDLLETASRDSVFPT